MKRVSIIGLLIILVSLFLAFNYHFNHFYEILLMGLFLFFSGFISLKLTKEEILKYYILGIIYGLIVDLILGVYITKLWYYPNYNFGEYCLLYLLVYPLGSIVIVQTYLFFENSFNLKSRKSNVQEFNWVRGLMLISIIFLVPLFINKNIQYQGFFLFLGSIIVIISALNYFSLKLRKKSLISTIKSNKKYFIILLFVSYFHAVLHEYPNLFVYQWVYQNLPMQNTLLFGVPLFAFLGWIILAIIPISIYYLIKSSNS